MVICVAVLWWAVGSVIFMLSWLILWWFGVGCCLVACCFCGWWLLITWFGLGMVVCVSEFVCVVW